jgi:hypothetical protein
MGAVKEKKRANIMKKESSSDFFFGRTEHNLPVK